MHENKKQLFLSNKTIKKELNLADNTVTYILEDTSNDNLADTKDKYFTPFIF